jgi:hypothetical protein
MIKLHRGGRGWTNRRSHWVVLDFLFLLDQAKRKERKKINIADSHRLRQAQADTLIRFNVYLFCNVYLKNVKFIVMLS